MYISGYVEKDATDGWQNNLHAEHYNSHWVLQKPGGSYHAV